MQPQTQVHKFGNRETAESVPYRQYFNQTQGEKGRKITTNLNDGNENLETTAKDIPPPANAAPFTPEAAKPREAKPMRKDAGNFHRIDTPPVHDEGVIRKSPINPHDQQHVARANYGDNQKKPNRSRGTYQGKPAAERTANDTPPSDKRIAPEDTPGRVRTNPSDRAYGTPHHDVAVPPFAGWDENDPASGEKYTGIFNLIADNRRNPGTPYNPPMPSSRKQESNKTKGCGCLSWILK
ncbi:DUF246 domain-containing protein [Musa troglodytarum]|uniref:DUF246 domain-containing protein n=1 Tax=Musa troglodytarum TaxID=320322 RepID=A0A9E7GZC4_9LILI|nr:DUF246 domain-containing protein [Musa troglodytarum]